MAEKRLYRSESDRMLGGVCGGFAEVHDMDPSLVRVLALVLILGTGFGIFAYLGAWLIMPSESELSEE